MVTSFAPSRTSGRSAWMNGVEDCPYLDESWLEAIATARGRQRVVVLGATDMGKSSFIRAVLAGRGQLIDLDPGQKMIGPPGTASLGRLSLARVDRFIFLGSTSASSIGAIARAAAELAQAAARNGSFIVNTSGFVKGLGARLQALTLAALKPDLIIEIAELDGPPIVAPGETPLIRIARSPAAQRKSAGARARVRQDAFLEALRGAELKVIPSDIAVEPGPPLPFIGPARPVCALADEVGTEIAYGILQSAEEVLTSADIMGARRLRLGRMWATPKEGVWHLLDKFEPAFLKDSSG